MRFFTDTINSDQSVQGPRIRVIGAGLPRCATSSLQTAFETPALGYFPCMHMAHVAPSATRLQIVIDAMLEEDTSKRHKLLHQIFDGYAATTDFPGYWFTDDLMDMYPDAPIVLNQRGGGANAWWKSFWDSFYFFTSWTYRAVCWPIKSDRLLYKIQTMCEPLHVKKWGVKRGPEAYQVYQDWVIEEAAKRGRKVLIWKAEDGWEPLCEFLGKEAPKDEPFPWVNDTATLTFVKRVLIARGIVSWLAIFGTAYASWRYWPLVVGQGFKVLDALRSKVKLG
ncbi:hypothetical protein G7046_g8802 [Stylonectria norvegica]|nr:hypothetical protein G7046_g8802 [Stylonectria norvegica]